MFMVFMSNPLLQDIYSHLHQLWASPSSVGSKLSFKSVIHTSAPPQKHSHTIQKPLNRTRILAGAAQVLNIKPAREKKMPLQRKIHLGMAFEDELQVSVNTL